MSNGEMYLGVVLSVVVVVVVVVVPGVTLNAFRQELVPCYSAFVLPPPASWMIFQFETSATGSIRHGTLFICFTGITIPRIQFNVLLNIPA